MPQLHLNQRINLIDNNLDIEIDIRSPYNRFVVTGEILSPTFNKTFVLVPKGLTSDEKDKMRNAVVEIAWLGTWGNKTNTKNLTILGNVIGGWQVPAMMYFFYNRNTDVWEYIQTCECGNGSGSGSGVY